MLTRPHEFWQTIDAPHHAAPPFKDRFPARFADGRILYLPIRPLGDSGNGLASLILNQASFAVERTIADCLATRLTSDGPEVVVGLPTLGLSLARAVAERLGHTRYVPLGTSKKFWYDEALSVPMRSITSPDSDKRLFLDPRMLPVLADRRVVLIDDVVSSGRSMAAALNLLATANVKPVAAGCAMVQTKKSVPVLHALGYGEPHHAFTSPLLERRGDGWHPV